MVKSCNGGDGGEGCGVWPSIKENHKHLYHNHHHQQSRVETKQNKTNKQKNKKICRKKRKSENYRGKKNTKKFEK